MDTYRQLLLTFGTDSFTSKLQLGFSNDVYLQGSGTTDELTIANNSSGQTKFINQSKTSMLILILATSPSTKTPEQRLSSSGMLLRSLWVWGL
jgi:hypothetical protein